MNALDYFTLIFLFIGIASLFHDLIKIGNATKKSLSILLLFMIFISILNLIQNEWKITLISYGSLGSLICLMYIIFMKFKSRSKK